MDDNSNDINQSMVNPVQVQKFLSGVNYPVSKEDLIRKAKEEGADENVIKTLEDIQQEEFNSPADVSEAIGKIE